MNKGKVKQAADKVINSIIPVDRAIDSYLYMDGGTRYEIQSFETEFSQQADHNGQPQHEVKGGLLHITLRQAADELLNRWMFQRNIFHNGTIVFAPISRTSNPPIKIIFTQARCISYQKVIGSNTGILIRLLISAQTININGVEHKNSPDLSNK